MIVSSKDLFQVARKKHFALPSANFIDQNSAVAYIEAAEELGVPLILSFAEVHQTYLPLDDAFMIGKYYAQKAKVPVVLHLDHGTKKDVIFKAVDFGFSSVMIDASFRPFDENVRRTSEIVQYAHAKGVVVEAEIGHVGDGNEYVDSTNSNNIYTTAEEARKFSELTGVDSLAISIGTAHGAYKGTPKIDFGRLAEISKAIDTPLVLHGGSSSGDDNLRRCAVGGISKINLYTDLVAAGYKGALAGETKDYFDITGAMRVAMKACLKHYFGVFETAKYNG